MGLNSIIMSQRAGNFKLEMILKMITEKAEIVRKFFDVSEYRPVKVTIFEDISDLKDEALKTKKVYDNFT